MTNNEHYINSYNCYPISNCIGYWHCSKNMFFLTIHGKKKLNIYRKGMKKWRKVGEREVRGSEDKTGKRGWCGGETDVVERWRGGGLTYINGKREKGNLCLTNMNMHDFAILYSLVYLRRNSKFCQWCISANS